MKKHLLVALLLCLVLAPVLALADSTLTVQGASKLSVAPDHAVLSVGFSLEDADASTAQQAAADAITAIVTAVKALGVEEADIATAYLNTYPVYNYTNDAPEVRGYRVEHMLTITVNDLGSVGDTLDAALKAGANQANSITYVSSKEKEVYLQALALAVEDAAAKAETLALASGVWLGGLKQVTELAAPYTLYRYGAEAQYDAAAGTSLGGTLMMSDLEVTATVELVYDIR